MPKEILLPHDEELDTIKRELENKELSEMNFDLSNWVDNVTMFVIVPSLQIRTYSYDGNF